MTGAVPRLRAIWLALALWLANGGTVFAQDADLCLDTADHISNGRVVSDEDRQKAHQACQRALAASGNVVQKYHLQEADFDITGTRPKN